MDPNSKHSSPLKFPCDFTFKIMGKANDDFERAVLTIMKKHFPKIKENAIQQRHSKGKSYLSLSITVKAENQQELDAAYRELSACKEILFTL